MFAHLRHRHSFRFPFQSLSHSIPHSLFLFLSLSLRIQGGWTRDGPRSTSPLTCSDSSSGPSSASSPSLTPSLSVSSAGYSPLNCSPSGLFAFITNAVFVVRYFSQRHCCDCLSSFSYLCCDVTADTDPSQCMLC
jgi:hypothetical protein